MTPTQQALAADLRASIAVEDRKLSGETRLSEPTRECVRSGPFKDRLPDPPGLTYAGGFGFLEMSAKLAADALRHADLTDANGRYALELLTSALDRVKGVGA